MIKMQLQDERLNYSPGETLKGAVYWRDEPGLEHVELHLLWRTEGKGDQDTAVVHTERMDAPQAEEARQFQFDLPEVPHSFSGKLISLVWGIEAVAHPSLAVDRVDIVIAPGGQEIILEQIMAEQE